MKSVVLIDGENLVHALVHILRSKKLIKSRDDLKKIDLQELLKKVGQFKDINYYSTKIQKPDPKTSLYKKVEKMRQWNSYWVPYIANSGVKITKAGILKVRDGKKCRNCGHKSEVLLEKGVDVRLGVDIVSLSSKDTIVYMLSSDSDLIPAIQNAKNADGKIVYVTFEGNVNVALSKVCGKTVVISKKDVVKAYNKANK